MNIRTVLETVPRISSVYLVNDTPIVKKVHITSDTELFDLGFTISFHPDFVADLRYNIGHIGAGETIETACECGVLDIKRLKDLTEDEPGQATVKVYNGATLLDEQTAAFSWAPRNVWAGAGMSPHMLAALVMPNDPAVDTIIHQAGEILKSNGLNSTFSGYKNQRATIINQLHAIWNAIANYKLTYALPPRSWYFAGEGQKVRTPSQILQGGCATCLDSTAMLAAVYAQAGFNPVIILVPEHAFIGIRMENEILPKPITEHVEGIRNLVELGELHVLETTMLTHSTDSTAASFRDASEQGRRNLLNQKDGEEFLALDIVRIWSAGVTPICGEQTENGGTVKPLDSTPLQDQDTFEPETAPEEPQDDAEEIIPETEQSNMARMDVWKLKLLDLSLKNAMLNAPIDRHLVRLVVPDVIDFENRLSADQTFRLRSAPEALGRKIAAAIKEKSPEALEEIYRTQAEDMYKNNDLLAVVSRKNLSEEQLQKRILTIYRNAKTNMAESGNNTLYVACGFLKWTHTGDRKKRTLYAPLVLIPVKLTRKANKAGFTLNNNDDDPPEINRTLLEMLKEAYNLRIPELEQEELPQDAHGLDIGTIFNSVRKAIREHADWEVIETCTLGILSFSKYPMWKDMCERGEEMMQNRIVAHLASDDEGPFPAQVDFPELCSLDDATRHNPETIYTPLSADSSQLSAVLAAGMGKNFVLNGPPGTGKSQTIANMIAHCMGSGKTVLFVAEKTAALSVVHKRLKRIGLGDFCLEMHSNKCNKKNVVMQFKDALEAAKSTPESIKNWSEAVQDLTARKKELAAYPAEIHATWPDDGTLNDDLNLLLEHSGMPEFTPCTAQPEAITRADKLALLNDYEEMAHVFRTVEHLYPGVAADMRRVQYSTGWEDKLHKALSAYISTAEAYDTAWLALTQQLGIEDAAYRPHTEQLCKLLALAAQHCDNDNSPLTDKKATERIRALIHLLKQAEAYRNHQAKLSIKYPIEKILDSRELDNLWHRCIVAASSNFFSKFLETRKIRKALQILARSPETPSHALADVEHLIRMKESRDQAAKLMEEAAGTLPHFFKGLQTRRSDLEAAQDLLGLIQQLNNVSKLATPYLGAQNPMGADSPMHNILAQLHTARQAADSARQELEALIENTLPEPPAQATGQSARWAQELQKLHRQWRLLCVWNKFAANATAKGYAGGVAALQEHRLSTNTIRLGAEYNLALLRLKHAIDHSERLTNFHAPMHEDTIAEYRQKDENLLTITGKTLHAILSKRAAGALDETYAKELQKLSHETTKQKMHLPPRQLLRHIPNIAPLLKPCMLMSPLSVAQYLSDNPVRFDVVIFDEASQIPVWDAIGAIARGNSAVIVGDPRQMPPTNFFAGNQTEDTDEAPERKKDLESILDECLARCIPEMSLLWHYRSRSESLIAFSNEKYYENKLTTFPAPIENDRALRYHFVKGKYERGSGRRCNVPEAEALVQHVIKTLKAQGNSQSIGIVTFNIPQQKLIQSLLDKACEKDEELATLLSDDLPDAVFVKNLENVQGDERDIIYFSTTYGPDERGHVALNFGPLSQTGGERRLNVAVTRARVALHVFSSMRPEDIPLNRNLSRGSENLHYFLERARNGFCNTDPAADGNIEGAVKAVCRELEKAGYQCRMNLGVSNFKINLAILSRRHEGHMLAGILFDGKNYAQAATVRDRDLLRESVLRGLGWNILHVWALQWHRDPEGCLDALLRRLEDLEYNEPTPELQPESPPDEQDNDDDVLEPAVIRINRNETAAAELAAANNPATAHSLPDSALPPATGQAPRPMLESVEEPAVERMPRPMLESADAPSPATAPVVAITPTVTQKTVITPAHIEAAPQPIQQTASTQVIVPVSATAETIRP